MINGIDISIDSEENITFCVVTSFSSDIQTLLREKLVSICEGHYHSKKFDKFFSYENTIATFHERLEKKTPEIKIGMMGELLCHLLFPLVYTQIKCISPFFNLEDGAIKKGHDLVFCDPIKSEIWAIEVKSGELGQVSTAVRKKKDLLSISNTAIKEKLLDNRTNLWRNALKGMDTVLEDGITKDSVSSLLSEYQQKTLRSEQKIEEYNVILATTLFHDLNDRVTIEAIADWKAKQTLDYKSCFIFSIQKKTYQLIIDFIEAEFAKNKDKAS